MNVALLLPAAGHSHRFGQDDKLAQDLDGRPVLLRAIEPFTRRKEVSSIIVAGPPGDAFPLFRDRFGPTLGFHGVTLVEGGTIDRWETVRRALDAVPDDATHIAVHDAARPTPSPTMLDRIFHAASSLPAVIPGLPISETVKRVTDQVTSIGEADDAAIDAILGDEGRLQVDAWHVRETVSREQLFTIQTPQVFDAAMLRAAYASDDLDGCTDDASVVERAGHDVHVVTGDVRNLKITTRDDLEMARAILRSGVMNESSSPGF